MGLKLQGLLSLGIYGVGSGAAGVALSHWWRGQQLPDASDRKATDEHTRLASVEREMQELRARDSTRSSALLGISAAVSTAAMI